MIRNPGTQSVPETLTNPNLGTGQATCTETWFYSGSASGVEVERCATRSYTRLAVELAADTAAEPGARLPHSCCGFASFTRLLTARADASIPWIWRLKPISIPFRTYPEPVLLIPGSQLQNLSPTFFCLCAHTHTHIFSHGPRETQTLHAPTGSVSKLCLLLRSFAPVSPRLALWGPRGLWSLLPSLPSVFQGTGRESWHSSQRPSL